MTPEGKLQKRIIDFLEKQQGLYCLKLIKTNKNGIADVAVFVGDGKMFFIEIKTEKGVISELQLFRQKELQKLGYEYLIPKGFEDFVTKFMKLNF